MQTDSKLKVLFYKLMLLLPDKWYIMLKFYKNFSRSRISSIPSHSVKKYSG